jgi:hypothetical protein
VFVDVQEVVAGGVRDGRFSVTEVGDVERVRLDQGRMRTVLLLVRADVGERNCLAVVDPVQKLTALAGALECPEAAVRAQGRRRSLRGVRR